MYLGIDFGTCFSSVAVLDGNGRAITEGVLSGDREGTGMPTVMAKNPHYQEGQRNSLQFICGFNCERNSWILEQDKIRYIKKQIRKQTTADPMLEKPDEKKSDAGFRYTRADLVTFFFAELLRNAILNIQQKGFVDNCRQVEGITITVPAGLGTTGNVNRHHEMRATYAGALIKCMNFALGRKEIQELLTKQGNLTCKVNTIAEPVAAAIAFLKQSNQIYAIRNRAPKGKILVLDLGGGTCDVTVLGYDFKNSDYPTFEVIDEDGDLELGGNDWTEALFDYVNNRYYRGSIAKGSTDYLAKKKDIEFAKITLSSEDIAYLLDSITITKSEFENVTKGLCQQVLNLVKKMADKHGGISSFERVVLVGGASRMPQIINGIAKMYPAVRERAGMFDPSKAIASGAAFYAERPTDILVKAPATYGINYIDSTDGKDMINNLIFKGDEFNKDGYIEKSSITLHPVENDQERSTCKLYESDCLDKHAKLDLNVFSFNHMEFTLDVPKDCLGHARDWDHYYVMRLYNSGEIDFRFYDYYKKDSSGNLIASEIPRDRITITRG